MILDDALILAEHQLVKLPEFQNISHKLRHIIEVIFYEQRLHVLSEYDHEAGYRAQVSYWLYEGKFVEYIERFDENKQCQRKIINEQRDFGQELKPFHL